jgi:diguanylate cyclase (GGDEF)-like protein
LAPSVERQKGIQCVGEWIGSLAPPARRRRLKLRFIILALFAVMALALPALASDRLVSRAIPDNARCVLTVVDISGRIATSVAGIGHQRDLVVMFATVMLCLLLWSLLNFILDRQPEVGLFAIRQAVYTLLALADFGYLAPSILAHSPRMAAWVTVLLHFAINIATILFCRELFKLYEPPRFLMRGLYLLLGAFGVLLLITLFGFSVFAIELNSALVQFSWLYFAVVAFAFRVEDTPRPRIMQVFFVAVCLSNMAFWLAGLSGRIASTTDLAAIQVLVVNGMAVGVLFALVLKARARRAQQRAQQSFLDLLRVQKKFEIEKELKKQAEVQAQTDFLTGVFNRRFFVESAEREMKRAGRFQRPLSLMMIDIDHFKAINDTWGHGVGDVVLQETAHVLRDALRNVDIFGRTGGEEFAAVLVETDGEDAIRVANRLCATVAKAAILPAGGEPIHVTVSIGLSQLKGRTISFDGLLNEADQAMYTAKEAGRNRFAVSE